MIRRRVRTFLFWSHLVLGLTSGLVIGVVALTGAVLAFEDEIVELAAPAPRPSRPAPAATPLKPEALIRRITLEHPEDQITRLRLSADPGRMHTAFLRQAGTLWLDPFTGATQPPASSGLRAFFSFNLDLHRWLAAPREESAGSRFWNRTVGRGLVGWSTGILVVLTVSGLFLWWPRTPGRRAFRLILRPQKSFTGRLRHWNRHHVYGFWSAVPILAIGLTGLALAFPAVKGALYPAVDDTAPAVPPPASTAAVVSVDVIFDRVVAAEPDWASLLFYLPRQNRDGSYVVRPLTIYAYTRSWPSTVANPLRFDPFTGDLLDYQPFYAKSFLSAAHALNRDVHTGAAFGWAGKAVTFAACVATLVLIYTGFALSFRRFKRRPSNQTS